MLRLARSDATALLHLPAALLQARLAGLRPAPAHGLAALPLRRCHDPHRRDLLHRRLAVLPAWGHGHQQGLHPALHRHGVRALHSGSAPPCLGVRAGLCLAGAGRHVAGLDRFRLHHGLCAQRRAPDGQPGGLLRGQLHGAGHDPRLRLLVPAAPPSGRLARSDRLGGALCPGLFPAGRRLQPQRHPGGGFHLRFLGAAGGR